MFQIIVDSAANIPAELVEKYRIEVISFINMIEGKEMPGFEPGLTPEEERAKGKEYYDAIRQGMVVHTSLINSGQFRDYFLPVVEKGEDILYISLSKNISGTYQAAKIAAEDLLEEYPDRKIVLVDSMNASLGQGLLAIYASEMRDRGMDVESIGQALRDMVPGMNGIFTVEDLKYLAVSGRISNAKAVVGNVLNIKPLLKGNKDGYIVQFRKCRGRKKSLKDLIDLVCNNIVDPENQIIGIAHADAYEESLMVMKKIREKVTVREFVNT
ncbi:MAG: DegV family protein, partial [Eubacterium sp.]|nr:DegV family protein [Eubacterium sp.]